MNTKKAIKIVTATAIAASAFTAVAPIQSEAATSLTSQIKSTQAKMKKPYDRYIKATKLASISTVEKEIKDAKKAQKDITAKIKKAKLKTKDKNKKLAEIKAYDKYITRAEAYVKAYKEALAASAKLNDLIEELEKAFEAGDDAKIKSQDAALQKAIKEAEKDIEDKVYGSKIEDLLMNKFTEPVKKAVAETKKAEPAKVNAYVKLAYGDLSTQAKIDAAQKARDAINFEKLKVAKQSALYKKLKVADEKLAKAKEALKLKTPATLTSNSASLLVADDAAVATDVDALYLTFSEPVKVVGDLTVKTKNGIAVTTGNVTALNQTAATGFDVDGNGKIEGTELNTVKVDIDLDSNSTYTFELAKGAVTDLDGNANAEAITFNTTTGVK